MTVNDAIKFIAGVFILVSLVLGHYVNEMWFLFTVFVGINLLQSSLTKWCLMGIILKKLGLKESSECCR
jgi:hypothetical protein